jgi:hypothetical protein
MLKSPGRLCQRISFSSRTLYRRFGLKMFVLIDQRRQVPDTLDT